ncbi:hypothetical protein CUC00_09730 [Prevotella intermedia]|nr:hypothetical protein CTM44_00210 [Prevotella intermedia]ATV41289.1 hypothetical protein CUC00_09730 [Prevotella intermedia]
MNCYRIYSFFIHKLSNAAKVINKGHLRGFSLPNVHYAENTYLFAYNISNFFKAFLAIISYSLPKSQKRITQR